MVSVYFEPLKLLKIIYNCGCNLPLTPPHPCPSPRGVEGCPIAKIFTIFSWGCPYNDNHENIEMLPDVMADVLELNLA
jgi:hypothetical protein